MPSGESIRLWVSEKKKESKSRLYSCFASGCGAAIEEESEHDGERQQLEKESGGGQDGGAREYARMSDIVITLRKIETKWC
ncbi:hypothetical protein TNCV_3037951 [Trichonephila clavipes]|nr:hypothetical protein TNCV_3037951 [Trichonephila clavipes]